MFLCAGAVTDNFFLDHQLGFKTSTDKNEISFFCPAGISVV